MQPSAGIVRYVRAIVGVLALFAVIGQFTASSGAPGFSGVNFLSYFTIESNIFVGLLLLFFAARPDVTGRWDVLRGAVTLYIVITGLVYNALLRGTNVDVSNPVYNEILHVVVPLLMLVDWLLVAPVRPPNRAESLAFLLFPALYFAYSLIRGPLAHWYPYPFLDPTVDGGYARVVVYAIVLLTVMTLLAIAVAELGRMARRRADSDRPAT